MREPVRARLLPSRDYGYVAIHRAPGSAWSVLLRGAARRLFYSRRCAGSITVAGAKHLAELTGPAILMVDHHGGMNASVLYRILPVHLRRNLYVGSFADEASQREPRPLTLLRRWYERFALGRFPIACGAGSHGFDHARRLLQQGAVIAVAGRELPASESCPAPYYRGVAKLAFETHAPVVPVFLRDVGQAPSQQPDGLTPGLIHVAVYPPHHFLRRSLRDATATLQRVMNRADGRDCRVAGARW